MASHARHRLRHEGVGVGLKAWEWRHLLIVALVLQVCLGLCEHYCRLAMCFLHGKQIVLALERLFIYNSLRFPDQITAHRSRCGSCEVCGYKLMTSDGLPRYSMLVIFDLVADTVQALASPTLLLCWTGRTKSNHSATNASSFCDIS